MTEKLRSFVVVMNFAPPGVLRLGSYIAPDEASAAALCAIDAAHTMRHIDPYPPLSNCLVVEETVEMLRHRLRAIEGRARERADVDNPSDGDALITALYILGET